MAISLAAELDRKADELAAAVEKGGLPEARPRSSPERRRWECSDFLILCAAALGGPTSSLLGKVRKLVRWGALAACDEAELGRFFALWSGVLASLLARNVRERTRLLRLVERIERAARRELATWMPQRIDLIVLGGSAGAIPAMRTVLTQLDPALAATVLVLLHVGEESSGALPLVLGRASELPVETAYDQGRMWLGRVYVAPPRWHLVVEEKRMRLLEAPPEHHSRPSIDVLLRSVARFQPEHAAVALLSGSGSDGTEGVRRLSAKGGVVLAQDLNSAEFQSLPASAIDTLLVQRTGSPEELGQLLAKLVDEGRRTNLL